MSEGNSMFKAFLTGGIVGAVVALLFAPESGEEIRRRIVELGENTIDSVETGKVDLIARVQGLKGELEALKNQAMESGQKRIREELEAISAALDTFHRERHKAAVDLEQKAPATDSDVDEPIEPDGDEA